MVSHPGAHSPDTKPGTAGRGLCTHGNGVCVDTGEVHDTPVRTRLPNRCRAESREPPSVPSAGRASAPQGHPCRRWAVTGLLLPLPRSGPPAGPQVPSDRGQPLRGHLAGCPPGRALALLHSPVVHVTAFTQSPPCVWDRKLLTASCPSTLTELPQRVGAFNPILQIRKLGPKRWRQGPRVTLGPRMSRWPLTHAGARLPPLQHSPG